MSSINTVFSNNEIFSKLHRPASCDNDGRKVDLKPKLFQNNRDLFCPKALMLWSLFMCCTGPLKLSTAARCFRTLLTFTPRRICVSRQNRAQLKSSAHDEWWLNLYWPLFDSLFKGYIHKLYILKCLEVCFSSLFLCFGFCSLHISISIYCAPHTQGPHRYIQLAAAELSQ